MVRELKSHIEKIKKFDSDRILWLRLSGFGAITILVIIVDLTFFKVEGIHWLLISAGLTLSVCWWYWTMKIIRELLSHRLVEVEILSDIVLDIREIKEDIKKLDQGS